MVIIIHQDAGLQAKNNLHQRQAAVDVCDAASSLDWPAPFACMGSFLKFDIKAPTLVDAFVKSAFLRLQQSDDFILRFSAFSEKPH